MTSEDGARQPTRASLHRAGELLTNSGRGLASRRSELLVGMWRTFGEGRLGRGRGH